MTRVIVLGGLGQFGRTAAAHLRRLGCDVQTASRRRTADLQVDANDARSIRAVCQPGDIVLDAAGPFQARTSALVEAAIEIGFDVVDINDDLAYAQRTLALEPRIASAGIRVLSSASTVSTVAAAAVMQCGITAPVRITAVLAPATRATANVGSALSLLRTVGQPIIVYRDGRLQSAIGWSEARRFTLPPPVGPVHGRLFESADVVHLPRIWPSLREVVMYVDSNVFAGNTLLCLAARSRVIRRTLARHARLGTWLARRFGSARGGIGYEIEDASGATARCAITAEKDSYLVAVAPAVLAVRAMATGRFTHRGLVAPDRHVPQDRLWEFLHANDIEDCQVD